MNPHDPNLNPDDPSPKESATNPDPNFCSASGPLSNSGGNSGLDERSIKIAERLWDSQLKESPLERKDHRTGAHFPELIKSERGVELLRKDLPSMLLCFMDKDNVGVLSDVGLKELADYLFEKEKEVFEKSFSGQDKFIRYAGDEFIYLTSDDKRGRQALENAFAELEKVRDSVIRDLSADSATYFGTGSKQALFEKITEAQKLAVMQKTMSGLSALYKSTTKGPRTPAGLAEWLFDKVGSDIKNAWFAKREIRPGVSTFAEAWLSTDVSMEKLAHDLQAFVSYSVTKGLFDGKDERPRGMSADVFQIAQVAKNTKLFGVSSAKVSVGNDGSYTALDIKKAINEAEKLIHKAKICVPVDLLTVHKRAPQVKERAIDAMDIESANNQVESYFQIKEYLSDPNISRQDRLYLKKYAVSLLCADPGCPEAYRLSRISNEKIRGFLDFSEDSRYCSSIRFKIPGFGAFNKQLRMELADTAFTEIMSAFKHEILNQFPEASANSIFIREGGGSAAVIFGSHINLSNFDQHEISKKLSGIFASKITDLTRLSFYEKQAFGEFAAESEDFPSVSVGKKRQESISDVLINTNDLPIWNNMSIGQAYNTFWPKGT